MNNFFGGLLFDKTCLHKTKESESERDRERERNNASREAIVFFFNIIINSAIPFF